MEDPAQEAVAAAAEAVTTPEEHLPEIRALPTTTRSARS